MVEAPMLVSAGIAEKVDLYRLLSIYSLLS